MQLVCRRTSRKIISSGIGGHHLSVNLHRPSRLFLTGAAAYASSLAFLTVFQSLTLASSFASKRNIFERNMSAYATHRDNGVITVAPKIETEQSGLVVICHGLGDSAEGFVDMAENLASQMPHLKFILPTAPTQPVTMNMGMPMPSWYDITGLDERSNENCNGILQSQTTLHTILQNEHANTSLPYHRMLLAGFSQGGALSLFTGMQMPSPSQKLAGIVVMSGYLPAAKKFTITAGLEDTPILHCHGEADPMVQIGMARRSQEVLTGDKGAKDYRLKTYPGLVHSVNPEEVAEVLSFLGTVLPKDGDNMDEWKVKLKDPIDMSVKELRETIRKAGLGRKAVGFMEKSEFVKLIQEHRDGKL